MGCQRCRLWGKLQTMGLGVALRILYAPDRAEVLAGLHRSHIVALFNALGRLSHSVEAARLVVPLLSQVGTGVLGHADTEYGDTEEAEEEGATPVEHHAHGAHTFSFNPAEMSRRSGVFGL